MTAAVQRLSRFLSQLFAAELSKGLQQPRADIKDTDVPFVGIEPVFRKISLRHWSGWPVAFLL